MISNNKWNSKKEENGCKVKNTNDQSQKIETENDSFYCNYKLRNKKRIKYYKKNSLKLDLNKILGNNNGKWTKQENIIFINSIIDNGNEWNRLEDFIKTRNKNQIRSHAQKFFEKLSTIISDENKKIIFTPEYFSRFVWMISEEKKQEIKKILNKMYEDLDNADKVNFRFLKDEINAHSLKINENIVKMIRIRKLKRKKNKQKIFEILKIPKIFKNYKKKPINIRRTSLTEAITAVTERRVSLISIKSYDSNGLNCTINIEN